MTLYQQHGFGRCCESFGEKMELQLLHSNQTKGLPRRFLSTISGGLMKKHGAEHVRAVENGCVLFSP